MDSLSVRSVIKKMMNVGRDPRTFVSNYYYPKYGIGKLSEAFEDKINANIIKSSPVKSIKRKGDVWLIEHKRGEIETDKIINTIPLSDFALMLNDLPTDLKRAAGDIEYRNSIFVFLIVDREKITDDSWIYYHPSNLIMSRVSQQKNFSPYCCHKEKTALTCEIFTSDNEDVWKWPESRIISRIKKEVVRVGLVDDINEISDERIYKIRQTYPLYKIGTEKVVEKITKHLRQAGIVSTGRQGSFYHTNMDHSIDMGRNAARDALR